MRNISFALTTQQVRDRIKTVTRRVGWEFLRPGDRLQAIVKGQGLKRGEHPEKICVIEVVDVRREALGRMLEDFIGAMGERKYGIEECVKEGFGDHKTLWSPTWFVDFFCQSHKGCTPRTIITRIEFKYV
jgi:hypothetical protein